VDRPFQYRSVTINGKRVGIIPGESVLHLASRNRIFIPTLCYDPRLSISGHCKVCFVEINGRLQPACTTKAEHEMIIETDSEKAKEARRKRVSAILRTHKGNCATCPQYEFCGLLELARSVGIENPVFTPDEEPEEELIDHKLKINLNRCVRCGKCVKVCAEIRKVGALRHPVLSPEVDKIVFEKTCEMCGQCAVVCPTGAIIEIYREKPDKRVKSVCTYCGTGCGIYIDVKDNKITGITTDELDPVGKGNLCVKGRFGAAFIHHPDRLKTPLIKTGGGFREATWDEAVSLITNRLLEIKAEYGAETIGGIGSARATNEDNYMFQRMLRAGIGTNNIDNCARLCHMPAATALKMSFGISASTSSFSDLEYSDVILVVGSNTTESHPIGALHVKWAHTRGARLIVIDPRKIPLVEEADLHLQLRPGSNAALFNGMLRVMIEENLIYPEFIEKRTREWEKTAEMAFSLSLEEVASITDVPKEIIIKAARIYGSSRRAIIISGLGIDENEYGTEWMLALINLSLATGNVGNPGTGVLCLRGQNNVQGAGDMGCLPNLLPGYQTIRDGEVRRKFSEHWGRPVPKWIGKKSTEMMDAAATGDMKALYIWGEDPAQTHGDMLHIRKALINLEFMVYQDIFPARTSDYADVILPAACFAEKDGTFTNTERRVRLLNKAIPPAYSARADWEIFLAISNALGLQSTFKNPAEIYDDMASLTYYFRGISHKRLRRNGLQWPCTHALHPGTERLYIDGFPPGRATFYPIPYREPSEKLTEEYPLILITGRRLYHFNNAAQTRRTDTAFEKDECLDMNPEDISRFNLRDGQKVKMTSRRGEVTMLLKAEPSILPGTVFASFHLWEIPINMLTGGARDTYTDTYSYKYTAVRVE
jgi:formate dehydrogenase (NADP+) alpha subunit